MRVDQLAKRLGQVHDAPNTEVIFLPEAPSEVPYRTSGFEAPWEVPKEAPCEGAFKVRLQAWGGTDKMKGLTQPEKRPNSGRASVRLKTALKDDTSVVGIKNLVDEKAQTGRK